MEFKAGDKVVVLGVNFPPLGVLKHRPGWRVKVGTVSEGGYISSGAVFGRVGVRYYSVSYLLVDGSFYAELVEESQLILCSDLTKLERIIYDV